MSLIKLASRLTKMYHTLSSESKVLAKKFERPTEQFVSGIERGNNNLIEEMKRKRKGLNVYIFDNHTNPSSQWEPASNNLTLRVAKNPTNIHDALIKRHEIFEGQQITGTKGLGKHLKKLQKQYNNHPAVKERKAISQRQSNLMKYVLNNKDKPNLSERFLRASRFLSDKKLKAMKLSPLDNPSSSFHGHHNPQVLINESKLVKNTPGSESFFAMRNEGKELEDLKKRFHYNY